jgi:hypothetical protein
MNSKDLCYDPGSDKTVQVSCDPLDFDLPTTWNYLHPLANHCLNTGSTTAQGARFCSLWIKSS